MYHCFGFFYYSGIAGGGEEVKRYNNAEIRGKGKEIGSWYDRKVRDDIIRRIRMTGAEVGEHD